MLQLRASARRFGISLALAIASVGIFAAVPGATSDGPQTLVIGVDQADAANQVDHGVGSLVPGRWFEYTDFFSRNVKIHQGDTLTFRTAPKAFHVIALAGNEAAARASYPVVSNDADDSDLAPGSGAPKIEFGSGNFPITGGDSVNGGGAQFGAFFPSCGITAAPAPFTQAPCTFSGGNDVESAGGLPGIDVSKLPANVPGYLDWSIQVNAAPGTYAYFCFIHPGMRGTFKVVGPGLDTTTQAQVDAQSRQQFQQDRRAALRAEAEANQNSEQEDHNGVRTQVVHVGLSAADNHVAIDEMLPARPLNVQPDDRVLYVWRDPHNIHTVSFPAWSPAYIGVGIAPDCSAADPPPVCGEPGLPFPEFVADPGTARPGHLTNPAATVDSGVLIGTGYGATPSTQDWSVIGDSSGTYHFQCLVHDWMQGTVNVGAAGSGGDDHALRSSTQPYSAGIARWMRLRQATQ